MLEEAKACTPLHLAASYGHTDVAESLIDASPRCINAHRCKGNTPLHYAAAHGHDETVRLLLEKGMNLPSMYPCT